VIISTDLLTKAKQAFDRRKQHLTTFLTALRPKPQYYRTIVEIFKEAFS